MLRSPNFRSVFSYRFVPLFPFAFPSLRPTLLFSGGFPPCNVRSLFLSSGWVVDRRLGGSFSRLSMRRDDSTWIREFECGNMPTSSSSFRLNSSRLRIVTSLRIQGVVIRSLGCFSCFRELICQCLFGLNDGWLFPPWNRISSAFISSLRHSVTT